jgi:hypothetical protein
LVEGGEDFPGALLSIFHIPHRASSFGPEHRLMHTKSNHKCSLPHNTTSHSELFVVLSRNPGLKHFKSLPRSPSFPNANSRLGNTTGTGNPHGLRVRVPTGTGTHGYGYGSHFHNPCKTHTRGRGYGLPVVFPMGI